MLNKKDKNKKKLTKKAMVVTASILLIFLFLYSILYFVAGKLFFKFAIDATFASVTNAPTNMAPELPEPNTEDGWFNNIPKTLKEIESDGYLLKGYEILNPNSEHKYVICIHGYRGNASEMTDYAYNYYSRGFNVILPNLKGHGLSEGAYVGMGYSDKGDILKWIGAIVEQDNSAKIVLHGVSMGAATVMFTVGENVPYNVVCAVEDCGYSNVYDQFKHIVYNVLNLPFKNTIMSSANFIMLQKFGVPAKQMDTTKALKRSKTPMLFIHGSEDDFVPFYMLDLVYNANENIEKSKLVVEGASHAFSSTYNPQKYYEKLFEFIENYV